MSSPLIKLLSTVCLTLPLLTVAQPDRPPRGERPEPLSFSQIDTDNSGDVTLDEFLQQKMLPPGDADAIFNEIDSNGDGVLSEQEMKDFKPPKPPER